MVARKVWPPSKICSKSWSGDIADEHEIVEEFVVPQEDGSILVDAKLDLEDFNEKLNLEIEDDEFNTIGGHVFGQLGREPSPGDQIETDAYILRIEESDRHRIIKLRLIHKTEEPAAAPPTKDSRESQSQTHVNNGGKNESKVTGKSSHD